MGAKGGLVMYLKIILEKLYDRKITLSILIIFAISLGGCAMVQPKQVKDTINQLSFSHDGKKILFDRCRENNCQIQVYELETGELSAYQSPSNERWTMAKYSYDGKKIVFSAIPMGKEYLDLGNMQITVMDPDGKNLKKVTTGPGAKIYPIFSHSGKKVLYARAGYIREKGSTPAAQFDAWEVNLETGKEKQLTYRKFFIMSSLTYFPDDEWFICNASGPEQFLGVPEGNWTEIRKRQQEWAGKYKANTIFVLKEEEINHDEPYIVVGEKRFNSHSSNPLLNKNGEHLLFQDFGDNFYLYSPDGNHRLVGGGGSVDSAAISPDGELLGVIYAGWIITIYRVQDGSSQWISLAEQPPKRVYGPMRDKRIVTIPEQPTYIINR